MTIKSFIFYFCDYLGNNRIVTDAAGTVIYNNEYYPFRMAFAESTTAEQSSQPYKYNGKEFDQMHGLNWYDYSARQYDPVVPYLPTIDPMGEKYYSWSPYVYVMNNPLKYVDPTGMDVWTTNNPEEIAKLLGHLQSVANKETTDPFNYGGWDRMSDDEYKEHNKDNSVSFNDDNFNFNINLEDYQGNFKAGMRSKKTNYAYISFSDLDNLLNMGSEEELNLEGNIAGLTAGVAIEGLVGPHILKKSKFAKMIFSRSARVLGARAETSILSLSMRRIWPKVGGAASKWIGGALTPVGLGLMYYESWQIGRELGQVYGGDAWLKQYRRNNKK